MLPLLASAAILASSPGLETERLLKQFATHLPAKPTYAQIKAALPSGVSLGKPKPNCELHGRLTGVVHFKPLTSRSHPAKCDWISFRPQDGSARFPKGEQAKLRHVFGKPFRSFNIKDDPSLGHAMVWKVKKAFLWAAEGGEQSGKVNLAFGG